MIVKVKVKKKVIIPKPLTPKDATVSTDFTKVELKQIIVDAFFEIEEIKRDHARKETEARELQLTDFELKNRYKFIRFFKLLKLYLSKKESDSRFTLTWMSMLLSMFFGLLAFFSWLFALVSIGAIIYIAITQSWNGIYLGKNIAQIAIFIMMTIFSVIFGMFSYCTSIEVEKEKDKNYLSSIFSGIVGLVVLIVALVALFK